jgi:hypothetical protein
MVRDDSAETYREFLRIFVWGYDLIDVLGQIFWKRVKSGENSVTYFTQTIHVEEF